MNPTPVPRSEAPAPAGTHATGRDVLVWDAPVRVFHWLMALSFAGAYLTAESESLRLVHVTLGYTMAGLVAFRLVWGVVGSRYARFSNFVRGPAAVMRYLRSLLSGQPGHYLGHNPAGALAIVALLGLTVLVVVTGWANYNEIGGDWTEEVHEVLANVMLGLVIVHIAAVVASSWLHRENLIGAMIDGYKAGDASQGIRKAWPAVAAVLLVVVLGFWAWQWNTAPAPGSADNPVSTERHGGDRD
jgi:cytochrome b